jgi:hypothetical protein
MIAVRITAVVRGRHRADVAERLNESLTGTHKIYEIVRTLGTFMVRSAPRSGPFASEMRLVFGQTVLPLASLVERPYFTNGVSPHRAPDDAHRPAADLNARDRLESDVLEQAMLVN